MITTATSPSVQRQQQQKQNLGGSFIHSHGTKVFMRPKLDDVLDAVQQARFNEKRWVWIEHEQYGYVRAHVLQDSDGAIEVELDSGLVSKTEEHERGIDYLTHQLTHLRQHGWKVTRCIL
jgi:hypothetical protein